MKKIVKLTEQDLKKIVRNSVKRILKEGSSESAIYNQWMEVQEQMGAEQMLNELYNWLNSDQIAEFLADVTGQYDLDYDDENGYM